MLVDITPNPSWLALLKQHGYDGPERVAPGLWNWPGFNGPNESSENVVWLHELCLNSFTAADLYESKRTVDDRLRLLSSAMRDGEWATSYGVCDSLPELVASAPYARLLAHPERRFTVLGQEMRKDREQDCGWRWHKQGPYVGEHELEGHEYFQDEPKIDVVWFFKIFEHVRSAP
jgi:hypothetical protein